MGIQGVPSAQGLFAFVLKFTLSDGTVFGQPYAWQIVPPLVITQVNLPAGTVRAPYSGGFSVSGGMPPCTWSIAQNALPPGLSIDSSIGQITGTPTITGSFSFRARVTDSDETQFFVDSVQSITISNSPPCPASTASAAYAVCPDWSPPGRGTPAMAGDGPQIPPGKGRPATSGLDTSVPHIARVYDYWLGGKDNFAVDREAAEQVMAAYPGILRDVRAQRAFLANAVTYLAGVVGIRQFLDIGTGIPTANNTHEVAQEVEPGCRVVYVDNDPMVLAHARALLVGVTAPTSYVDADLRDTGKVLVQAARLLDFSKPVAVMLISVLHLIPDDDDPYAIVTRLMDAVPSGSWLALSHPARDVHPHQVTEAASRFNKLARAKATLRTRAEILRFFDGLELLESGLVQVHQWRPGTAAPGRNQEAAGYCGLARKP